MKVREGAATVKNTKVGETHIHRLTPTPTGDNHFRTRKQTQPRSDAYPTADAITSAIASRLRGMCVGSYIYPGDTMRVLRINVAGGKEYRPIHRANGGWREGDPPLEKLPLYRGDKLNGQARYYVTEGEKAADAAASLGMVAITSAHGAESASKTDWTPAAQASEIIILPDNDTKGAKYAQAVARELLTINRALRVKILNLPGLPAKGDIVEFIEQYEDADPKALGGMVDTLADAEPLVESSALVGGLITRCASDIVTRDVEWLWPNRFVANAINLLCGMPDCGKSLLTCAIAGNVTTGRDWPMIGGVRHPCGRGSVAFIAAEDSPETTCVPRLKAAGADLSRVHFVEGIIHVDGNGAKVRDSFDIARDVNHLEQMRQQLGDLRLVVIDPLDSYLNAKVDTNVGNKVRAALWPLKDWAESRGVTIIIVHHFNKSVTFNAMDRVSGARSFGALPRSVWAAGRDDATGQTVLAPVKLNLVAQADKVSIAYTIESSPARPGVPVVCWSADPVSISATELLGGRASTKTGDAAAWLRELLTTNGAMPGKDIEAQAQEAGHNPHTLRKAREKLGIQTDPVREGKRIVRWVWRLPDSARVQCEYQVGQVGQVAPERHNQLDLLDLDEIGAKP
jgi:putative DNA primase/helicase